MSKYIPSDKQHLSPILSGRMSKKLKEACVKCKPNSNISPDLSQAAKRKMTKKIRAPHLDSKKTVTPGIKLELEKRETYDVKLKKPVVKNVYIPCGIYKTNVLQELQSNKIMHLKSVSDGKFLLFNSSKTDDQKEISSEEKNEWPTLKTDNYFDQLPDKEEIYWESDICNCTSPDLSLRKHTCIKVNKLRSNRKLIRKNLFGCVPDNRLNERSDTHNNLHNLFDKTEDKLVPVIQENSPNSSVLSQLISENLDGSRFNKSLLDSSKRKIETRSKMISAGKYRKTKRIFNKSHRKIISKKTQSYQQRDMLKENENSKRYGILHVTLRKSSVTKRIDDSLECVRNDSNIPLVCGENITGNYHELMPIASSFGDRNCEGGTPRKNRYYFDSDEESFTISEVSSPIKKVEINSCIKPVSQLKCMADDKAWSFNTDHFQTTFSNLDDHKKSNVEFISNSDDLSSKKQISIPLSEKYKELSHMLKKQNKEKFVISEGSSESSPEEKNNFLKTSIIKKRTKELKLKQLRNKNYSTPVLDLEIHSQKPNNFTNCKVNKNCRKRAELIPEKSFECNVEGNNKKQSTADVMNGVITDHNQLYQVTDYHCSDVFRNFSNDEKQTHKSNNQLHKDYVLHEDDSFSKSQVSELIIESISSQSNTGNNGTDLEIEFSDVSSLPVDPQTPPSKLRSKNRKDVNINSSSKKTNKKYPDNSLIGRLRTVKNRYNSNASVLQHMLNKKEAKCSTTNLPVFYVKRILETYSETVIACRPLNESESTDVRKYDSYNNLIVSDELLILTDPTVFTSINVVPGSNIKIHPPWKVVDDPENNFKMVLGPSCIEVLTKGSYSQCVHNTSETRCIVTTDFNCSCHQDFVKNSDCHYAFSDELFTEVFCPPPKISVSSKFMEKTIPKLYDYADQHSGTIGHARAFNLLNPNMDIFVSIVTVIKEKVAFMEHEKLCIILKDIVNEISILILMIQSDVDKWNIWTNNSGKIESHFRINGLKFTHRIPLQNCQEILNHLPTEKVLQNVIYCLSPVSNMWNVTEII